MATAPFNFHLPDYPPLRVSVKLADIESSLETGGIVYNAVKEISRQFEACYGIAIEANVICNGPLLKNAELVIGINRAHRPAAQS